MRDLNDLKFLCIRLTRRTLANKTTWERHDRLIGMISKEIHQIEKCQTKLDV